jgi:hypothetical protein
VVRTRIENFSAIIHLTCRLFALCWSIRISSHPLVFPDSMSFRMWLLRAISSLSWRSLNVTFGYYLGSILWTDGHRRGVANS